MGPLRVELAIWIKWLAWFDIALFGLAALLSQRDGFPGWWIFLFFVAGGIFLLLILGPIEMNDKFIQHTSPLTGRCRMEWDEVEKVEIAPKEGGDMVLHGQGKRLAVPGINLWSAKGKEQMVELFNAQIEKRGIPIERTVRAGVQTSKDTRRRR